MFAEAIPRSPFGCSRGVCLVPQLSQDSFIRSFPVRSRHYDARVNETPNGFGEEREEEKEEKEKEKEE